MKRILMIIYLLKYFYVSRIIVLKLLTILIFQFSVNAQNIKLLEYSIPPDTAIFQLGEPPMFKGGSLDVFEKYVLKHLKYPFLSFLTKHEKNIRVKFVITKDGNVNSVELIKKSGIKEIDSGIIWVIENSIWMPYLFNGEARNKTIEMALKIN
jgi:hypothetical protein